MKRGIYPAAVTPMTPTGEIDLPSAARLLAYFESKGCAGVVLAGTNGEGPSLSAVEKRDLVRGMVPVKGKLEIVLAIATSSLSEAIWSATQARKAGADAVLLMPPFFYKEATSDAIVHWMLDVMQRSEMPTLIYNFPQRTGIDITPEMLRRLFENEHCIGLKDSSGKAEDIPVFGKIGEGKRLYVGAENLLLQALDEGWSGSISGAANSIPASLVRIFGEVESGSETVSAKFASLLQAISSLKSHPQPAIHKAVLRHLGIIEHSSMRLPLLEQTLPSALLANLSPDLPT